MAEATGTPLAPPGLEAAFQSERGFLLGVAYRLVGSIADAEDVVQATFERALARPPKDTDRAWRPWLVRVAVNLGRDHLRRRRRRGYDGPWLPSPIATPAGEALFDVAEPADTQGRYELMESVSFAFLVALEALTPTQRAVLILRDVFDYDGRETAVALDLSEANVRQHLHRARRAMGDYDELRRDRLRRVGDEVAQSLLARFLVAVAQRDVGAVEALLAEDVVMLSDGGGEFHAARVPVRGANKVARFFINISKLSAGSHASAPRLAFRRLNGIPAVVVEVDTPRAGIAPRFVTLGELDADGRMCRIWSVLATAKLVGLD